MYPCSSRRIRRYDEFTFRVSCSERSSCPGLVVALHQTNVEPEKRGFLKIISLLEERLVSLRVFLGGLMAFNGGRVLRLLDLGLSKTMVAYPKKAAKARQAYGPCGREQPFEGLPKKALSCSWKA